MDYEKMELNELKEYAKSIGLSVGNIGKEKLIEKIEAKESENKNVDENSMESTNGKDKKEPLVEDNFTTEANNTSANVNKTESLLDSITSAIDDLDDSADDEVEEIVDLPNNYVVRVKSMTFGGLTYKSRTTNAVFRWNQIGAVQDMTILELNEMNNYKTDFLRKPLVILMDEKAVKKFRLTPVYENVAKINNLSEVFKSDININLGGYSFGTTADGQPGYRKPGADTVTPFNNLSLSTMSFVNIVTTSPTYNIPVEIGREYDACMFFVKVGFYDYPLSVSGFSSVKETQKKSYTIYNGLAYLYQGTIKTTSNSISLSTSQLNGIYGVYCLSKK